MSWLSAIVDLLWRVFQQIVSIFYESSIFIVLGFTLAGILHEFVPLKLVSRRLGKPGFKSIFWATALGAPLPLCSSGVLPTAAALRRSGASKPAHALAGEQALAPEVTRTRLYRDVVPEALRKATLYVIPNESGGMTVEDR